MTEKVRYVAMAYHAGAPIWFVLDKPPLGLPHTTSRLKIGAHHYFLRADSPMVDAASGTTVIFVQVLSHHSLWGNNISPEGTAYELTRVDTHDFRIDTNWREVDNPFAVPD